MKEEDKIRIIKNCPASFCVLSWTSYDLMHRVMSVIFVIVSENESSPGYIHGMETLSSIYGNIYIRIYLLLWWRYRWGVMLFSVFIESQFKTIQQQRFCNVNIFCYVTYFIWNIDRRSFWWLLICLWLIYVA